MAKPFKGDHQRRRDESVPGQPADVQPLSDRVGVRVQHPVQAGEGLNIGREGAEPVTDDYPGERPWAFAGGTIHKAIVDVSGKPFVNLAQEARMAFARD
jgi:hypothetical protein